MSSTDIRDLPSDTQTLHKSVRKLDRCKCYSTDKYDNTEKMIAEVDVLTCECLWRIYQREAQRIVAPGGRLIADPIARNARINAAYASLWLADNRFEWAGLAAFASKQVGCGFLHAASSIHRLRNHQIETLNGAFLRPGGLVTAYAEINLAEAGVKSAQYVSEMLALGNTSLFLDIFPLHLFYLKRGIQEMKKCLDAREKIYEKNNPKYIWPGDNAVKFGFRFEEIIPAFEAIEAGNILASVDLLARHEQKNILQPIIYEDSTMQTLLRGNQFAFVTGLSAGFAQKVELTLANQCNTLNAERSVEFSPNSLANLASIDERMKFVERVAKQFHALLRSDAREEIAFEIAEISSGKAAR